MFTEMQKNGIKGAAESSQTFNGGSYNVTAVNNGIAADESITINGGTFNIAAATSYDVCVKVKDSDGTIVKKYFTLAVSK